MEENKKQSIYELLDFKVTDIETHIGQSLTAEELHLKMENRITTGSMTGTTESSSLICPPSR